MPSYTNQLGLGERHWNLVDLFSGSWITASVPSCITYSIHSANTLRLGQHCDQYDVIVGDWGSCTCARVWTIRRATVGKALMAHSHCPQDKHAWNATEPFLNLYIPLPTNKTQTTLATCFVITDHAGLPCSQRQQRRQRCAYRAAPSPDRSAPGREWEPYRSSTTPVSSERA